LVNIFIEIFIYVLPPAVLLVLGMHIWHIHVIMCTVCSTAYLPSTMLNSAVVNDKNVESSACID